MKKEEVRQLMEQLKRVFDIVRLVDVSITKQFTIDSSGELREEAYQCYEVWNKTERCANCISAKALANKSKLTKFEFIGSDIYHVIAMYVEVEEIPYVLEMVLKITDELLIGAYGENEFVETISNYNRKLYFDPVTDAYNRQYYEDQLRELSGSYAVAMLDADDFKRINDTYGHPAGDLALQAIVRAIFTCVRSTDTVIRYGGDEFLVILPGVSRGSFAKRLENMRKAVHTAVIEEFPQIRLSVSVGGVYASGKTADLVREADRMLYRAKARKDSVELLID